jgi:hypothetical protein
MTHTTRLKELLERQASSKLFDGEGDHEREGTFYYAGGLECLFPLIAQAAVEDGVSARTVMKFLVSTAFEILSDPRAKPGEGREIGALVVQEAQRLYSTLYPSPEEIEELKREAAAWRAAHPHLTTNRQATRTTH